MDDVSFTIPKYLRKSKGIRSAAHITASVKDKQVDIEHLSYDLDIIRINGKGTISPDRTMNLDIGMNVQAIERVAPLFFFENDAPKGDLSLAIVFRDLKWPLRKIPYMKGLVKINNGFVKLPWFAKPLNEINLTAEFKGDTSEIQIKKLVSGQTTLSNGTFSISGLESPHFSLSLTMDNIDFSDFQSESDFAIRSINPGSFMAKVTGDFSLQAGNISLPNMSGTQLRTAGTFRDRKLSINQLTGNILGGYADVRGNADLSNSIPAISVRGKIQSMTGGHFLRALGAKTSAIDGEGAVTGDLLFKGENKTDFVKSLQGNISIYSRNGTIRKWNLLSKIFGLLNLYDLFRGKVHFTEEGLTYTKMGAAFTAKEGIFTTNNFLLDSPSMLITGSGSINVWNKEANGDVTVSPLVTLDKTINKIPIIRSILREKSKGFFYVSYNVKGNIEDPTISTNYVSTMGGRTVETLKNILVLPKDLFEKK
jgi:hypothetical protein